MLKSGEKCNHPLIYGGEIDHVLAALFLSDHPRLDLIRHCTDLTFGAHECCSRPREESRPAKVPAEEALGPLVWFPIAGSGAFSSACRTPPAPEARPPPFALHELFELPLVFFVIQAELLRLGSDI